MKLDLYAEHRDEYVAPREPTLVDVGPARYLAISGRGTPGGPEFAEAVGALYNVSFTTKMAASDRFTAGPPRATAHGSWPEALAD